MGSTIEAVAVSCGRRRASALRLADDAARACLLQAHVEPDAIDLLVNAGIYRDRALGEPALAALIQEDVGANPGHPQIGRHGTFSFDVSNGACGVVTGMQVADGFLRSGAAGLALVVASDASPGHGLAPRFPAPPAAGAVLLGWDDGARGLVAFRADTYPEFGELRTARLGFRQTRRLRGRNMLCIEQHPSYRERAVECAAHSATAFLDEHGLSVPDVDLWLASGFAGFEHDLGERLGLADERLVHPSERWSAAHTAGPAVTLDAARRRGLPVPGSTVLLVAAGAGIAVVCALYRA